MKKIYLILIFALIWNVYPCINEYEEDQMQLDLKKPNAKASHNYLKYEVGFDKVALKDQRKKLLKQLIGRPNSYKILSGLASIDLKIGDKNKAVKVLDSLVKLYPNEYNINANLGTGYELIGNNKLALKYIKRSVQINPASHNGSEWIHVNILKEKLKKKPDYSKIMALNFDRELSDYSLYGDEILAQKRVQLAYQLNERIAFLGYNDPIVSQLLIDYADLVAITDNILSSKQVYQKALLYKGANKDYINHRIDEINSIDAKATFSYYAPLFILTFILVVIVMVIVQRNDVIQRKRFALALGYAVFAFFLMATLIHVEEVLLLLSPIIQFVLPFLFVLGYKKALRGFMNFLFCILATGVVMFLVMLLASPLGYNFYTISKILLPWVLCMSPYMLLALVYKFSSILKNVVVGTLVMYALLFLNSNYMESLWGYSEKEFISFFIGYFVLFLMFIVSQKRNTEQSAITSV